MSLTANQPYKTMLDKRIKWKAQKLVPPFSYNIKKLVKGGVAHDEYMFQFEPMRIRQFDIEYNRVENKQKLSTSSN